jgi:hypothetical protein
MKEDDRLDGPTRIALAICGLFRDFAGGETMFDLDAAVRLIEAYADRRVREALRPRRGKIVALRMVGR